MPTVLVVDDDRLLRESLCEMLMDWGCESSAADNGTHAIDYLTVHRDCDLVVSDIDMPDISGFELLARMQNLGLRSPVLLISARADQHLLHAAQAAGARHLFPKPVPSAEFSGLVHQLLHL